VLRGLEVLTGIQVFVDVLGEIPLLESLLYSSHEGGTEAAGFFRFRDHLVSWLISVSRESGGLNRAIRSDSVVRSDIRCA
jgi:hypothetical protein